MKIIEHNLVFDNPVPQLCSRHGAFPCLCKCANGNLAAVYVIGEAFESVDQTSYISFSKDEGKTWSEPYPMYDKSQYDKTFSDYSKIVCLPDGRLLALGYAFIRNDPSKPIGNPQTGGVLDDFVFCSISDDNGKTWSKLNTIECAWGPHIEASAPVVVLEDGSLITPVTGFPDWEGNMTGEHCGRALRSFDCGKTWNDDSVCMEFPEKNVLCYEQRMCQLESGTVVCIAWNENVDTGERMANHYTFSTDGGATWSKPESTGIFGQASSVCAIGGERLLAVHAVRRDTDRPGIYGYIIDFSEKKWNVVDQEIIWEPETPVLGDKKFAEIFAFLKFGQPGAILLNENTALMSHWFAEQGQYKVMLTRIEL